MPYAAQTINSTPTPFRIRDAITRSLKQNIGPGLLLQAFAVAVLLAFYFHAPTQAFFGRVTDFRTSVGLLYGVLSTAFFGGLVPFVIQRCRPAHRWRAPWRDLPFLIVFWGFMGAVVDRFYALQAHWFGDRADAITVMIKVGVDQLFFAPCVAVPFITLAYAFKDHGYRFPPVVRSLNREWFQRQLVPVIVANAMVWVPVSSVVYLLPLDLQLPIQNFAQCFWCVLLLFLTTTQAEPSKPNAM